MKVRVRFGEQRFTVNVDDNNPTLLALKQAICSAVALSDVSALQVSLNGRDILTGNDHLLPSHGMVSGDMVYATVVGGSQDSRNQPPRVIEMESSLRHQVTPNLPSTSTTIDHGEASRTSSHNEVKQPVQIRNMVIKPIFCRDGISASLATIYEKAQASTHYQAVMVILHALMVESGFVPQQNEDPYDMPTDWNRKSTPKLKYLHTLCSNVSCEVVVTLLGPHLYAHAMISGDTNVYQVKLVMSHYVRGDIPLSSGARMIYQNLHKASRLVKDNLIHPLLANLRHRLGITSPFTLVGLPPEIQLTICSLLDAKNVLRLSQTCKALHYVSTDQKLWNFFCQQDFGVKETLFSCWKKQYKESYRQKQHSGRFFLQPLTFNPEIIDDPDDVQPINNELSLQITSIMLQYNAALLESNRRSLQNIGRRQRNMEIENINIAGCGAPVLR